MEKFNNKDIKKLTIKILNLHFDVLSINVEQISHIALQYIVGFEHVLAYKMIQDPTKHLAA